MSIGLIKKNSSSPFHLQRSMIDQGESDGSYEQGGFDPNGVKPNIAVAEAIVGFGQNVGSIIASRTKSDDNKEDLSKVKRLEKRKARLEKAKETSSDIRDARINKRQSNIDSRLEKTNARIKEYNEFTTI